MNRTKNKLFLYKDAQDIRVCVDEGTKFDLLDSGTTVSKIMFLEGELKGYIRIVNNDCLMFE